MPDSGTPSADAAVTLREVTFDTVRPVCQLAVREDQTQFVAANALSIAEAYFAPDAWFRAIYADDTPVGFVMLSKKPEEAEYFLWRYMIDQRYQRRGYGRRAMELVIEHVRGLPNATELVLSHMDGEGNPGGFYEKLGFRETGEMHEGEWLMRLAL